jgi:membrane protein implicated in regulation of membrane protease activity
MRRWMRRPASLAWHVVAMLVLAVAVFVTAVVVIWLGLGAPRSRPDAAFTTTNQLETVKLALAVVAGVGGVVALVVAYRRQAVIEEENERARATARRDDTRLFNERFNTATTQLGHDRPAVRVAAVYAITGLADDAPTRQLRQTCISVLCAYLRQPYEPEPTVRTWLPGEREVRQAIIGVVRSRLAPHPDPLPSWNGFAFNLRGAVFDGLWLPGIEIGPGTVLNLEDCRFVGGPVDLTGARFAGGRARFAGHVLDAGAAFVVDRVTVEGAPFDGPDVPPELGALVHTT